MAAELAVIYFPFTLIAESDLKRLCLYVSRLRLLRVEPQVSLGLPPELRARDFIQPVAPIQESSVLERIRLALGSCRHLGALRPEGGLLQSFSAFALHDGPEVPSCVLMFKQELPLMFPDDADVQKVKNAFYDPFEYLMLRHREGKLKTDFKSPLVKVSYHAACHQRVQNIGPKTKETLSLVPGTEVDIIERCSGHDGTYAVKKEFHEYAVKIVKPVVKLVNEAQPDHYGSDCAMAGHHIAHIRGDGSVPEHPITLLRKAYGI